MRSRGFAYLLTLLVSLASCAEADVSTRADRRVLRHDEPRSRPRAEPGAKRKRESTSRSRREKEKRRKIEPRAEGRGPVVYVSRVVDGDTIEVVLRGTEADVRLIGFDTPETVHPSEPVECFGRAATAYTTDALEGRSVTLEFDVERTDRYGRTLAYVWLGERLFNERILRDGYAAVSTYPPNVKYVDRFLDAQRAARARDRGLWGRCGGVDEPAGDAADPVAAARGKCDPGYSGACIPSYPPDLDCADVPATNFSSTGNDPHGFDGDSDGIACEG